MWNKRVFHFRIKTGFIWSSLCLEHWRFFGNPLIAQTAPNSIRIDCRTRLPTYLFPPKPGIVWSRLLSYKIVSTISVSTVLEKRHSAQQQNSYILKSILKNVNMKFLSVLEWNIILILLEVSFRCSSHTQKNIIETVKGWIEKTPGSSRWT